MTELKLLIHIGQHKNIVNILGACTKGNSTVYTKINVECPFNWNTSQTENTSDFLKKTLYLIRAKNFG